MGDFNSYCRSLLAVLICPNCHRQTNHAEKNEIAELLSLLFNNRQTNGGFMALLNLSPKLCFPRFETAPLLFG